MLPEDRVLLAKVASLNQALGEIVLRMWNRAGDDGALRTEDLREMGSILDTLSGVVNGRADTVGNTIDADPSGLL
jgi:hypothetical protein